MRVRAGSLLKILAFPSLLIALAFCGLWIRSVTHSDLVRVCAGTTRLQVSTYSNVFAITFQHREGPPGKFSWMRISSPGGGRAMRSFDVESADGLEFDPILRGRFILKGYRIAAPFWFLILLCAAPQTPRLTRWFRGRLYARDGMCRKCGYDLRASYGRCPECGDLPIPLAPTPLQH